jgi:phosphatidylinositol alpha-1,6-mannosyltransferase
MRILALVTDAFGGHGGIAQYNRDFLASLAASDVISDVIALPRRTATATGDLPPRVRQLRAVQGRLAYSLAAFRAAQVYRPVEIIFCGHLYMAPLAAAIARFLNVPLWVQVHGLEAWQELPRVYRRSIEAAALVTSVSRYTRRRMLEWVGIDPVRVKVLPNTVDPRFRPGPKPDYLLERYQTYGKRVLMTVSRLPSSDRYKGLDRVIRALPQVLADHPETLYLVVGDGDDCPRLEGLAAELGVREKVRFAGLVSAEELPDHFRLADVLVMPSTGEGFGIVFVEAMASGISVIGGNQDGSLDPLCDGATGIAVNPDDGEQVASAIRASLDRPRDDGSRAGRFRLELFAEHLDALLRSRLIGPQEYRS